MIESVGLVALGLVTLVVGGELLLRGAVGLASALRLTPAVIGLTVVAAGTSVPELAVSAIAAAQGSPDLAVGNVIGSSIFNIAFIIGFVALIRPPMITGGAIRLEYPVLVLVTLMVLALAQDGRINRLDAVLCIAVYSCFTAYLVTLVREQLSTRELSELRGEVAQLTPETRGAHRALPSLALAGGGIAVLWLGARTTVDGAVSLAQLIGLSDRVIGLTVVAIGTSLPELATSLVAAARGEADMAVGNIVGSNLFNLTGIVGTSALLQPMPVGPLLLTRELPAVLILSLLSLPLLRTGRLIARWEGGVLLASYLALTAWLVT